VPPTFADLGVPESLVARLRTRGIEEAFEIQAAAIPDALAGRDVVGKAATGSGKTLAFGLPLVTRLERARPRHPRALVLVPTRELAAQVQRELSPLVPDRRRVIAIYGGTPYGAARKALTSGVDLVVACPGRLEDLIAQGAINLSEVTTVVVDEADRMADMGFLPAVRRLVGATSPERHVMLFSATMGPDVASLVREFTRDAVIHDVTDDSAPSDVEHYFWRVSREERPQLTAEIVEQYGRAIVFTRTKHGADRLARQLGERGVSAVALHGDRSQAQRERALKSVQDGRVRALVATDVAARGIHIDLLPVVVHYDPPTQATDYLHRSGRTGRAGATGAVVSLVGEDTLTHVGRLQRALGWPRSIEPRESAPALRLGAVDDAVAAERLEDPTLSRRSLIAARPERRAPRGAETPRRETRRPAERRALREGSPRATATPRAPRASGHREATVTFFNDARGFGFATDEAGDDLFIHFSQIVGDGFRSLAGGQRITFEEARGPKGREARNVRVVGAGHSRR
jgi:superfamily II DNA/RNA helicase